MPELAEAIEGPAKLVVGESCLQVELPALRDPDLHFIVSPRISNQLPVVDASLEACIS